MEGFFSALLSIPAWMAPAIIALVLGLAALVVYILGMAQGYTNQDYIDYRAQRRKKRQQARRRRR